MLNLDSWEKGRPVLEDHAELTDLFRRDVYTDADRARMIELPKTLDLDRSNTGEYGSLVLMRGNPLRRLRDGEIEIKAKGASDWVGWLELRRETVDEAAIRNTATVIAGVDADILAVIEAEDRITLDRFNHDVLKPRVKELGGDWAYWDVKLIDGNDSRGIEIGLMTRPGYTLARTQSHLKDLALSGHPLFSRDCLECEIKLPSGEPMLVMVNHFNPKGYGSQTSSNARRRLQVERVAEIYEQRLAEGGEKIVVCGDLNDTPKSKPLAPLTTPRHLTQGCRTARELRLGRTPGNLQRHRPTDRLPFPLPRPLQNDPGRRRLPQRHLAPPPAPRTPGRSSTRFTHQPRKPQTTPPSGRSETLDQC